MLSRVLLYLSVVSVISAQAMVGGWTKQDVNSKDVQDLVNKAVTKYNAESNDLFYHIPVEVKSAESQVVSGVQYKIKLVVGQSSCMKNQVSATEFNASNCEEKEAGNRKDITAVIWQKPWEDFEQIDFE